METNNYGYFLDIDNRLELCAIFDNQYDMEENCKATLKMYNKNRLKAVLGTCTKSGLLVKPIKTIMYIKEDYLEKDF